MPRYTFDVISYRYVHYPLEQFADIFLTEETLEITTLGDWSVMLDPSSSVPVLGADELIGGIENVSGDLADLTFTIDTGFGSVAEDVLTHLYEPYASYSERYFDFVPVAFSWGENDEFQAELISFQFGHIQERIELYIHVGGDALPENIIELIETGEITYYVIPYNESRDVWNPALFATEVTDLNLVEGTNQGDTLVGSAEIDEIYGQDGPDRIEAGDGDDYIFGESGSDSIIAGAGDDYIEGGASGDVISSGDGNDYVLGGDGRDQIGGGNGDDTLLGEAGFDIIGGGDGDDVIDMGIGNGIASGGAGDDSIVAGQGMLTIGGSDGNDTISIQGGLGDNLGGGAGDDRIYSSDGNDLVGGGDGDDYISGGNGDDFIAGGAGNDSLLGGTGNDTINGGAGRDTMIGGSGEDIFVFTDFATPAADIIEQFEDGSDLIRLVGFEGGFDALHITLLNDGYTVRISAGEQNIFVRSSYGGWDALEAGDFTAEDFLFL